MDCNSIIKDFIIVSDSKYKNNVVKLGIPEENSLGVSTPFIRKYAKTLGKNNELAFELWNSGYHELKLLATLVFFPQKIKYNELNKLINEVYSWDLCDMFCKEVVVKSSYSAECINNWIDSSRTFVKRASIVTMCSNVIADRVENDEVIYDYVSLCMESIETDEIYIRKAISWTLREIGKYNLEFQDKIVILCHENMNNDSKSTQWIMKDVLREVETLVPVKGRRRLISIKSKMGKEK